MLHRSWLTPRAVRVVIGAPAAPASDESEAFDAGDVQYPAVRRSRGHAGSRAFRTAEEGPEWRSFGRGARVSFCGRLGSARDSGGGADAHRSGVAHGAAVLVELREAARSVEDIGFDSLWVPDHIEKELGGHETAFYDVIAMLGGLAAATKRITIGASVHNAALRPPCRLAHAATTLDEISNGRFVLGIGAGGRGYEYRYLAATTESGYARLAESIPVVAALLDGERVTFQGQFWSLDQARLLHATDHKVPLMVGAAGPKTIDLAFRWGDEWNTAEIRNPTIENLTRRVALADEAAARHDRLIRRSIDLMVAPTTRSLPHLADTAITGYPERVAETLLRFADLGFDDVHCYGPAPSQEGGDGWSALFDHLNAEA